MEVNEGWRELYLDLLAWRRDGSQDDPENYPPLSRDEWRLWAARQYRWALELLHYVPFPAKDHPVHGAPFEVNQIHRKSQHRRVRLVTGALFYRAMELGWDDLAERWAERYWKAKDIEVSESGLRELRQELLTLERAQRVPGLG